MIESAPGPVSDFLRAVTVLVAMFLLWLMYQYDIEHDRTRRF